MLTPMPKKERVRAALTGEPVDHVPISLWGHDFLREWSARDLAAQTVEAYRAHDWDFIKLNPRWTFFAEAWGNTYQRPTEQRFPRLLTAVVQSVADLDQLDAIDPAKGAFGEQLEALSLVLEEVGDEVDVLYTLFSPLAVLGLLCGALGQTLLNFAHDDPARVHTALARITTTLAGHASLALQAGASGLFYAPLQWASRRVCTEDFYREFGRPYDLQLLADFRDGEFNVLHVCGNDNMLELLLDYPVRCLNWADRGEGNPSLSEAAEKTSLALMGGIDNSHLHEIDPAMAASEADTVLDSAQPRFLLAGGCGISPLTSRAVKDSIVSAARSQTRA